MPLSEVTRRTSVRKKETRGISRHKGLSTVIGAIFMIIVMAGALNVTIWTLQQQDKITQAVVEKTNANVGRLNKRLTL